MYVLIQVSISNKLKKISEAFIYIQFQHQQLFYFKILKYNSLSLKLCKICI